MPDYLVGRSVSRAGCGIDSWEPNRTLALPARLCIWFFILAGLCAALVAGGSLSTAVARETAVTNAVQEQILASTIQIGAYDDIRSEGNVIHSHVEEGLGTLVAYGGQQFIMTHNHWDIADADLDWVELRDGHGSLLVMLEGRTFSSLMRFHDAGTLLIAAPPELSGIVAVSPGGSANLVPGDGLWITTRDKQKNRILHVSEARVKQAGAVNMPEKLNLHGPKTAVAPGDSGGGVWHDGRLVGNMWAIVESLENTPWSWQGWFSSPGELQPTGDYIAARLPLVEDTWLTDGDRIPQTAEQWIYEPVDLP